MTIHLINDKGQTLLDVEVYIEKNEDENFSYIELNSNVPIRAYSKFLMENKSRESAIIETFSQLDELRNWLWDTYFNGPNNNNIEEYENVNKEVKSILNIVAKRFNLTVIED